MQGGAQLRGDVELEEGMSDDEGDEESADGACSYIVTKFLTC